MQIIKIVTSVTVEHLKQKARKLKREKGILHTQALDEIAKSDGFEQWYQVVEANSRIKPAEVALSSGCVMAFDVKDGMDIDTSHGVLNEDPYLEMLTEAQLFDVYANLPDEYDELNRTLKETLSDMELREFFESDFSFMFFRLNETHSQKSLEEVLKLIQQYAFWMPHYVWLQGNLIDTYNRPVEDSEGNIAGVRF